jgi:uroporphyrinogen-III synthase
MTTTALITRPDEDAEPLAAALGQRGIEVVREPLLAVRPLPGANPDLAGVQALVFTSANGVRAFTSLTSRRDMPAYAVGDATARVAREAGFAKVESAGGTVEDLARLVEAKLDPKQGPLLHAAGSAVAGDLAGRLGKAGFELRRAVVYETETATQLSDETREKLAAGEIGLVLLFSPRTAETFVRLARAAGPAVGAGIGKAIGLALSPAVARVVEALPWRSLRTADRPELAAMLALVDRAASELEPTVVPPEVGRRASGGNGAGRSDRKTIVDVTPEPVPNPAEIEAALKRMTPKRRSGGLVTMLVLLLALAAAGYFTQNLWRPYLDRALGEAKQLAGAPASETGGASAPATGEATTLPAASGGEASDSRLSALEAELATLRNSVATLEAGFAQLQGDDWQSAAGALQRTLAETGDRLAALEQEVAKLGGAAADPNQLAALRQELEDQAGAIKSLEQQLAVATSPAAPADATASEADAAAVAATTELGHAVDALRDENAALKAALEEARARLAELTPLAERVAALESKTGANAAESENVALLLAVARLGSALNGSRPFAPELQALDALAEADSALKSEIDRALQPIASRAELGIATLADLRQAFPDLARKLAQTGTGEDLADAAGAAEAGWFKRFLASLADLVTVRPTGADAAGDSMGARVARAEAALDRTDLVAAAAELDGLSAAADWVAAARARAAAGPAIDALEGLAVARLGKAADDAGASGG